MGERVHTYIVWIGDERKFLGKFECGGRGAYIYYIHRAARGPTFFG